MIWNLMDVGSQTLVLVQGLRADKTSISLRSISL